ncbi:hypothetical protein [Candidatus Odyssella acanthamoebae]|uniref:Uncharacterized protein n=1 Tax=Candidatus Odyssella acanthamoebae TaxID=91604 RepID=A0A077AYW2_9PROT|nr:hypothetical protein [Candidatus Paracaedibacter acanthamoebae]AIK95900.1 hypothetical protein ID47_02855 [Candidatus Paracaedibacter acanthamoebae]
MASYNTKYWKIEISDERKDKRINNTVVKVLVNRKETQDSVMITIPARNKKLNQSIVGIFHKWLLVTEDPVSTLNTIDQLNLFERTLIKIDQLTWGKNCLA